MAKTHRVQVRDGFGRRMRPMHPNRALSMIKAGKASIEVVFVHPQHFEQDRRLEALSVGHENHEIMYSSIFRSYFCAFCNEWLEPPSPIECVCERPERPIITRDMKLANE